MADNTNPCSVSGCQAPATITVSGHRPCGHLVYATGVIRVCTNHPMVAAPSTCGACHEVSPITWETV